MSRSGRIVIGTLTVAILIVLFFTAPLGQKETLEEPVLTPVPPPVIATQTPPPTRPARLMPGEAFIPTPVASPPPPLVPTPTITPTPTPPLLVPVPVRGAAPLPPPLPQKWRAVKNFLYQLQNVDLRAIGQTKYDLVVIDYSSDRTAARQFSPADIASLKSSPGGQKLVLAYMSLGEAEDIRYYWKTAWELNKPAWLDSEIMERLGNYRVRYWLPEWQNLMFGSPESYLDKIIAAGFDGVYLDHVNNYEYYVDSHPGAPKEMVDFVVSLARYARETKGLPDFGVFVQNGEELYSFPEYLAAITGIAREGLYFGYEAEDQPTRPEVSRHYERLLDQYVASGRSVLVVDYTTRAEQIERSYQRARSRGYIPFTTVQDLNRLVIGPAL